MNVFRRFSLGLLLSLTMVTAFAAAVPGRDFAAVNPPQPTDSGTKIEVVEFFSYACPHCNHLEPALEAWARRLPANVVIHRIPVTFGRPDWVPLAKLYLTLETLGEADRLNGKVFQAVHEQHINLASPEACTNWAATQGLDGKKFADVYNSFGIASRLQRANLKAQAYAIDGVPALIVDGRYRTSPAMAGGNEQSLAVTDELIAAASKEHR